MPGAKVQTEMIVKDRGNETIERFNELPATSSRYSNISVINVASILERLVHDPQLGKYVGN